MLRILLVSFLFVGLSCSSETPDENKKSGKVSKEETKKPISFTGTPKEVGEKLLNHFFTKMRAKDLDGVAEVLHSNVVYMDVFKGKEKVVKHIKKTFDNREVDWITLKEMRFQTATEEEIVIYTKEYDDGGLGIDNYGYYKIIKEDGQFRIVTITIPSEELPEIFKE